MGTRSSPEDPGEKERPRWIEGPTATSSQPEAQPQMAHIYDNGDGPGTQPTADAESDNFPCNASKGKAPPTVDRAPTASQESSSMTEGGAHPGDRALMGKAYCRG